MRLDPSRPPKNIGVPADLQNDRVQTGFDFKGLTLLTPGLLLLSPEYASPINERRRQNRHVRMWPVRQMPEARTGARMARAEEGGSESETGPERIASKMSVFRIGKIYLESTEI